MFILLHSISYSHFLLKYLRVEINCFQSSICIIRTQPKHYIITPIENIIIPPFVYVESAQTHKLSSTQPLKFPVIPNMSIPLFILLAIRFEKPRTTMFLNTKNRRKSFNFTLPSIPNYRVNLAYSHGARDLTMFNPSRSSLFVI